MKQKYRALDGLRFVAAYAVVLYHYAPTMASFEGFPGFVKNVVEAGPAAIGFFYILSGFVLTKAYEDRKPLTAAARSGFWLARLARLYPVYLLAFFMFGPIAYFKYVAHPHGPESGLQFLISAAVLNLVALQAWTPLSNSWNGPSWSLSVEAFFYLLFPFLVRPLMEMRWSVLVPILVCAWLAMIAIVLARLHAVFDYAVWHGWIQYCPLFWLPLFVGGIAVSRLTSHWLRLSSGIATTITTLAVLALLLLCGLVPHDGRELYIIYGGSAPLLALIILGFTHPTAISSRVLNGSLFAKAGAVSYATYILQAPLWHGFAALTNHFRHVSIAHPTATWQLSSYLVLLLLLSFVVRDAVGRPAQRWISERFITPTPARSSQPARDRAA